MNRGIAAAVCLVAIFCYILYGSTPSHAQTFPLHKSKNNRYLVGRDGKPFFIVGDSPQALMVNITEAEADSYFANRAKYGFNSVWINLLCADYTGGRKDASTSDGILPWTTPGDLSTPNEAYFAHCDRIIKLAAKHGLLVFLDPAETGSFLKVMLQNGTSKCREFGRYLGKRYRGFDNILWFSGNDFQDWKNEASDAVVLAVAKGIKETDPGHLHTIELDYQRSSSLDDARWATIISLNGTYTYYPTYAQTLKDYNRPNALPVFMMEADYEFENGADSQRLRLEGYWSALSGATGQIYGNGSIWPFKPDWKEKLDTPGAEQITYWKELFVSRPWFNLVPDQMHTAVTAGYGTFADGGDAHSSTSKSDYVAAARTADGGLLIAYLPTSRTVTVDMSKMKGPTLARWFDPTNGKYTAISDSPITNKGTHEFTPHETNAGGPGNTDWVLVLEASRR